MRWRELIGAMRQTSRLSDTPKFRKAGFDSNVYVDLWSGDYADGPAFEIGSPRDLGTCLC